MFQTVLHPVDLNKRQVENQISLSPLVFDDESADTPRDICQIDGRHIRSEKAKLYQSTHKLSQSIHAFFAFL